MSKEIQHRPECMEIAETENDMNFRPPPHWPTGSAAMVEWLIPGIEWARHLEARLAKYETFAPSPKPGATIVTKHTQFDPDRRPAVAMDEDVIDPRSQPIRIYAGFELVRDWARHLESVREGLQAQLNQYERQEKQRLESELATRESEQRDRSSDH